MTHLATTCQIVLRNPKAVLDFTVLASTTSLPCGDRPHQPLEDLITKVHKRAKVRAEVRLFTLIYLLRLKQKLPKNARGAADTPQRLFLAATLTSSKFLAESGTGLTSRMLSKYTDDYDVDEINRMERSFLGLLRFDLWVSMDDIKAFICRYGHLLQAEIIEIPLPASPFQVDADQEHDTDTDTDEPILSPTLTTPITTPSTTTSTPKALPIVKSVIPHLPYQLVSTVI